MEIDVGTIGGLFYLIGFALGAAVFYAGFICGSKA